MSDQANWVEINNKHLAAMIVWVRLRLQRLVPAAKPSKQEEPKVLGVGLDLIEHQKRKCFHRRQLLRWTK
ncbi:MAG: hypothetical protein IPP22_13120 [Nitrosomonas sp.]|nr:hypothetical protein [Nitrosomonas sp.]